MKKYEFTGEVKVVLGITLKRIKRLSNGAIGGWIEKEENLSHVGDAWVCVDAQVYGAAQVSGAAQVYGNARVYGNALVCGNARVSGDARVYGNALVCGNARVSGDARVYGDAQVYGAAQVCGDAQVYGNAWVCGDAQVSNFYHIHNVTNFKFNVTITPQNIVIGCKMYTHAEIKKMTMKKAIADGMPREEFAFFKNLITLLMEKMKSDLKKYPLEKI